MAGAEKEERGRAEVTLRQLEKEGARQGCRRLGKGAGGSARVGVVAAAPYLREELVTDLTGGGVRKRRSFHIFF